MKKSFVEKEYTSTIPSVNKSARMYHIDGMKGILCFMVMFGHFWNIYRGCQEKSMIAHPLFDRISESFIGDPLLVASFWLYAFLVISGFLLSVTRIRSVSELMIKSVKRFLRFCLPVFGACVFIFLLQETVGFYVEETEVFFTNNWFQKYYRTNIEWYSIFTESFRAIATASCQFNAPFWVVRDMFLSSVIIYICNYVDYGRERKNNIIPILCFLNAVYVDRPVIIACLAGYLLGYYKDQVSKLVERKLLYLVLVIAVFLCAKLLMVQKILPSVFDKICLYIIVWCAIVAYINQSVKLVKFFSGKIFLLMSKISFGIYSFHWPVICSIGSYVLIKGLENKWGTINLLGLSLLVSVLCTIGISIIYRLTVEKTADKIIRMF